jgi:multidrug efflux pump subunit AcrA (membrane-fusion protein)
MKNNSKLIFFSLALIAGLLLSACGAVSAQPATSQSLPSPVTNTSLTSEGNLAPRDFQHLSFAVGGTVAEVLVKKGEQVTAGQVLACMGNREQSQASLTSANMELTSAQQAYDDINRKSGMAHAEGGIALANARDALISAQRAWDDVDTSAFQTKLDDAQALINTKQEDLKTDQDDFNKVQDLSVDNPTRKTAKDKLDAAQTAYNEAMRQRDELVNQQANARDTLAKTQADVTEAQRQYDATQSGPDPDKLALATARLNNAKAQVSAAQAALDNLDLKAPFAGTVVDINVSANELASPSSWAVLLADFSQWYVDTKNLTELNVVKVAVGQAASMVPDALPGVKLSGKVTEISNTFQEVNGDITYKVRILLDGTSATAEPLPNLRWGMTVQVTFDK